ncbi:MAG: hypothetical protein ABIC04_05210 [Nanoarchaeota archaeon]
MVKEELEKRLKGIFRFLSKYSMGLIDDKKPPLPHVYFSDTDIVDKLTDMFDSDILAAIAKGEVGIASLEVFEKDKFLDFFADLQQIHLDHDLTKVQTVFEEFRPDLVLDICSGDGEATSTTYKLITQINQHPFRLYAMEQDVQAQMKAMLRSTDNIEYVLGRLTSDGEIISIPEDLTQFTYKKLQEGFMEAKGRKTVVALNACGFLSDHVAKYASKNNIDSFCISRCHYNWLEYRPWFIPTNPEIPMTDHLVSKLSSEHRIELELTQATMSMDFIDPENPFESLLSEFFKIGPTERATDPRVANLLLYDLIKQAITIDLALQMNSHDYNVVVVRWGKDYAAYGSKHNK